ncbi:DUF983 domain-containing protein [uncultured Devosia sp.]|uniref:DUF983 domain-containing protein n=1 Tax=uncultured Devosia sp. TaxID=211434 RepID=UPI0035CC9D0D
MPVQVNTQQDRSVAQAMWRGVVCKCPNCGEGRLFRTYLKVVDTCPVCSENLSYHRADDFPPYIAIMIVGHLLVALMLHMEMAWHVNPMVYLYTLLPLAIILPLAILPSVKGAIVGLQWAARMHGFDPAHRA